MFTVLYKLLIIWIQQFFFCYLYVCKVGILLLFLLLLHEILIFWNFQLKVSLLCCPKWIGLEFPRKLQLPKMPGKFQHNWFWIDKFRNFMLTYILVSIFINTRFSLIYLSSFTDGMIGYSPLGEHVLFFNYWILIKQCRLASIVYK